MTNRKLKDGTEPVYENIDEHAPTNSPKTLTVRIELNVAPLVRAVIAESVLAAFRQKYRREPTTAEIKLLAAKSSD